MQTKKILGTTLTLRTLHESLNYNEYLYENTSLSTVHYITTRMLINATRHPDTRNLLNRTDMLICAETDILRAAGINSRARQYEIHNNLYLKELCRQIQRNDEVFYLLSETPDKLEKLTNLLSEILTDNFKYKSGTLEALKNSENIVSNDNIANEINDIAPRIIISNISFPYQLQLMHGLKPYLNARIWLGLPAELFSPRKRLLSILALSGLWKKISSLIH